MNKLKPCNIRGSFAVLSALRGADGIGVSSLTITGEGELITILSDGRELNAGKLPSCSLIVDDSLSDKSLNPVENRVISLALQNHDQKLNLINNSLALLQSDATVKGSVLNIVKTATGWHIIDGYSPLSPNEVNTLTLSGESALNLVENNNN